MFTLKYLILLMYNIYPLKPLKSFRNFIPTNIQICTFSIEYYIDVFKVEDPPESYIYYI